MRKMVKGSSISINELHERANTLFALQRKAGEKPHRAQILVLLYGADPYKFCFAALAAEPGLQAHTSVVRAIETGEQRGFVYRKDNPNDKRKSLIGLTSEGEKWVEKFAALL